MDKKGRVKILELEARLGFNFPSGLFKASGIRRTPAIQQLIEGVRDINCRYVGYAIRRIRTSKGIHSKSTSLFHNLGPKLWPGDDPSPAWLFGTNEQVTVNPHAEEYPRSLRYSDPEDRTLLLSHFLAWIYAKLNDLHQNFKAKLVKGEPLDPECLPNSESSDYVGDGTDSDAKEDDDDNDRDEEYVDSKKSCRSTPRSASSRVPKTTPRTRGSEKGMSSRNNFPPAPTAPMFHQSPTMGNTESVLENGSCEPPKSARGLESKGRQANERGSSSVATGSAFTHGADKSSVTSQSPSLATINGSKRAVADDAGEGRPKKRKPTREVAFPLPRLIFRLKLTAFKGHNDQTPDNTESDGMSARYQAELNALESSRAVSSHKRHTGPHPNPNHSPGSAMQARQSLSQTPENHGETLLQQFGVTRVSSSSDSPRDSFAPSTADRAATVESDDNDRYTPPTSVTGRHQTADSTNDVPRHSAGSVTGLPRVPPINTAKPSGVPEEVQGQPANEPSTSIRPGLVEAGPSTLPDSTVTMGGTEEVASNSRHDGANDATTGGTTQGTNSSPHRQLTKEELVANIHLLPILLRGDKRDEFDWIGLENDMFSRVSFFDALEKELREVELMEADEEITRAQIKWVEGEKVEGLVTDIKLFKGGSKTRGWTMFLEQLETINRPVRMKLEALATVRTRKDGDAKA